MKILIVEDSRVMRQIILRTLRQVGYGGHQVIETANGCEALAACRSEDPDLVLSGWNMPVMDGIELLATLRRTGSRATFGFVTSEGSTAMRKRAEDAGASFLIAKPFTEDGFRAALEPMAG